MRMAKVPIKIRAKAGVYEFITLQIVELFPVNSQEIPGVPGDTSIFKNSNFPLALISETMTNMEVHQMETRESLGEATS